MIRTYFFNSQSTPITDPYVHFVTTEVWNKDVERGGNDPMSEEWQNQRLLLLHLNTTINLRGSVTDVDITTVKSDELIVLHSVLPGNDNSTFLTFPFKECANQINIATDGLTVLANPFFKFQDEGDELCGMQFSEMESYIAEKKIPFESAPISYHDYKEFKKDVESQYYKKWFNDAVINFFSRWSMRNTSSKYVMATEIIDVMVTMHVKSFFEFDFKKLSMDADGTEQSMHQVPIYLESHIDLLSKKFIFSPTMRKIITGGDG